MIPQTNEIKILWFSLSGTQVYGLSVDYLYHIWECDNSRFLVVSGAPMSIAA